MRVFCTKCRCANISCYCTSVDPFVSYPRFAILIHRREARRTVASGRMTHRFLANSLLIEGSDFTTHAGVNALIEDPAHQPFLLYPGPRALRLDGIAREASANPTQAATLFDPARTPLIFVLDATWAQAKRMYRFSQNLRRLPQICFTPTKPSRFFVRRQPRPECVSTIEAVHRVIDMFPQRAAATTTLRTCRTADRPHDRLLRAFDEMVRKQQQHAERRNLRFMDKSE